MSKVQKIKPYRYADGWVFDDNARGLIKEGLVGGTDTIIDYLLLHFDVKGPFILKFSDSTFKDSISGKWVREEDEGNIYEVNGMEGWLCPNFLLYFDSAPKKLYVLVESIGEKVA